MATLGSKSKVVDPFQAIIGNFGRWQFVISFLFIYNGFAFQWQILANKFITYNVEGFECQSYDRTNSLISHQCDQFMMEAQNNVTDCGLYDCDGDASGCCYYYPCNAWSYPNALFTNTITERFNLVCSKKYQTRLSQTLFFTGSLIGAFIFGHLSDRFGRKTIYLIAMNGSGVFGLLAAYASTNFAIWVAMTFLRGMCVIGFQIPINVYMTEVIGGKWRSYIANFWIGVPAQIAQMVMGLFVYLVPDMKMLELVLALFGLATLPLWYFMPESPRWLLIKGHKEKAFNVIKTATKMNGNPEDAALVDEVELFLKKTYKPDENLGVLGLLKYPGLRRNFFLICCAWFCVITGYYGLIYNTPVYGWNLYLVFVFPTFFTIPAYFICPYIENKLGRKFMLTIPMGIAGLMSVSTLLVPRGHFPYNWPVIVLCIAGVVFCSISLNVGYTYTKELFPTTLRATGLSASSIFARVGAMIFPLIAELDEINEDLPIVIFGLLPILGSIVSIFVWPETAGIKLPDSVEEAEEYATSKNKWLVCC